MKVSGVIGKTPFMSLKSFVAYESSPCDIMHLLFINIPKFKFHLWSSFETEGLQEDYKLNRRCLKEISEDLQREAFHLPHAFGRKLRDIKKCSGSFKAEEWKLWVLRYSLPLLKGRLPKKHWDGWGNYVRLRAICVQKVVSYDHVEELRRCAIEYFLHYQACYARKEFERMHLMRHAFHYFLHIADSTLAAGPLANVSQFPMERHIGHLSGSVVACRDPSENITKTIHLMEQIKLLKVPNCNGFDSATRLKADRDKITNTRMQLASSKFPQYRCHSFLGPRQQFELSRREQQLLRQCLRKIGIEEGSALRTVTGWRRLEILTPGLPLSDAVIVAASENESKRSKRCRSLIAGAFNEEGGSYTCYGLVEKLFSCEVEGNAHLLALISWAKFSDVKASSRDGTASCNRPWRKVFTERSIDSVEVTQSAVGFIELKRNSEDPSRRKLGNWRRMRVTCLLKHEKELLLENFGLQRAE